MHEVPWAAKICWKTPADSVEDGTNTTSISCWVVPLLNKYRNMSWSLGTESIFFRAYKVLDAEEKLGELCQRPPKHNAVFSCKFLKIVNEKPLKKKLNRCEKCEQQYDPQCIIKKCNTKTCCFSIHPPEQPPLHDWRLQILFSLIQIWKIYQHLKM